MFQLFLMLMSICWQQLTQLMSYDSPFYFYLSNMFYSNSRLRSVYDFKIPKFQQKIFPSFSLFSLLTFLLKDWGMDRQGKARGRRYFVL